MVSVLNRRNFCALVGSALAAGPIFASRRGLAATSLRIASGFPKGFRAFDALDSAARAVTAKTEGRVKIELVGQTTLGQDDLPALEKGELDGAVLPSALLASVSPSLAAIVMPLAAQSFDEAAFIASKLLPTVAKEIASHGLEIVARSGMGFAYLLARAPLIVPSDFKGRRLWTPKQPGAEFDFGMTGAIPVPLGFDEVEAALTAPLDDAGGKSPKSVDCVMTLPDLAILKQWHRHLRFLLDLPLFVVDFQLVMRSAAIESLAEADRAIFQAELKAGFSKIEDDRKSRADSFRRVLERAGFSIHVPTAAENALWTTWRDELSVKFAKDRAIPDAARATLESARAEFRKTTPAQH